jgi:Zn-dependent metalloprotease
MHFLSIFIVVGIGIPPLGCENPNKPSLRDHFIGVDMELPIDAIIKRDEKNNTIRILKGGNLSKGLEKDDLFLELQSKNEFSKIATAFISANSEFFRIKNPAQELTAASIDEDDLGFKHIRFQQVFSGIPVWAAEINVHLNRLNNIYLVQGRYIPTPVGIDIHPALQEDDAKHIVADLLGVQEPENSKWHSETIIFASEKTDARLAYRVVANLSVSEGWAFILDAETGDLLEKLPTVFTNKPPLMKVK